MSSLSASDCEARVSHGQERDAAPMSRAYLRAQEGDILVAINQRRLSRELPPEVALRRLAGKEVHVTLRTPDRAGTPSSAGHGASDRGSRGGKAKAAASARASGQGGRANKGGGGGRGGGTGRGGAAERTVRVRVSSTGALRRAHYVDWVASRRELVHHHLGGVYQLGYLHVPDMEERGYADFTVWSAGRLDPTSARELCSRSLPYCPPLAPLPSQRSHKKNNRLSHFVPQRQYLAEGPSELHSLIVDLRGNCGGMTSDLLLARLTQRALGRELAPHGCSASIPEHAAPSNLVILIDEHTASDGELLAHSLHALTGAPLVGARTWGGVIAMDQTELVDGTTISHPAYVLKLDGASLPIENRGVVPTLPVEAMPHDGVSGRDRQLEAALALAAKQAEESKRRARELTQSPAHAAPEDAWLPLPRERTHWSLQ